MLLTPSEVSDWIEIESGVSLMFETSRGGRSREMSLWRRAIRPLRVAATANRAVRRYSQRSQTVELQSGLPLLASTLWRCATRYPMLEMWEEKQLVPATLSVWERHRLFLLLNTPAQLKFDAEEFLTGAKTALELLLHATKSREFSEYVMRGDPKPESVDEAVERVRQFCTPRGFTFHENVTKQALDRKLIIEVQEVEVESIQLNECVYGQVSRDEFRQELHGKRNVINEITDDATLERLFVSVKATVNETLKRELIGEEVQVVQQKNVYFAVLASDVTTPDVVDWAFVANVLGSTLRSNEISREKLKNSVEADSTAPSDQ